jgi:hypothetical protein
MEKVIAFVKAIPRRNRANWARRHGMDPVRISQFIGRHKGIGIRYAAKILAASGGALSIEDFIVKRPRAVKAA